MPTNLNTWDYRLGEIPVKDSLLEIDDFDLKGNIPHKDYKKGKERSGI